MFDSMALSPRAKLLVFRIILLMIPLSVAMAAIGWYGVVATRPYLAIDLRQLGDGDIIFDRTIGFVRPAHAETRRIQKDIDYTIYTDRFGARVNAAGVETAARVDILTIGCSFSEGHAMPNESTYTEDLGRALSVPVANFAVGSYGGVQSELSLERHTSLAPKVIIYGLIEDHLRRNLDPCAPSFFPNCLQVPIVSGLDSGNPHFTTVDGSGFVGVELTDDLLKLRANSSLFNRSLLGLRTAYHEFRDWRVQSVIAAESKITDANKVNGELFVLQRMARQAKRMHAALIVMYMGRLDGLPDDPSKGWLPLPDAVRKGMPEGVIFLDTTPYVSQFYARNPTVQLNVRDGHPNATAHELFATILRDEIVRRHLLDRNPAPVPGNG
jgi:hypothetical protein